MLYALASAAQTNTTVKVASAGIASDIGFFIADKKGYFRDEGLDVELTQMANSPQMIGPLGMGQLDVGAGTVAAGPLQRRVAEHRDPRRRRQRLDAQGLRLLRPDGAQGPGR